MRHHVRIKGLAVLCAAFLPVTLIAGPASAATPVDSSDQVFTGSSDAGGTCVGSYDRNDGSSGYSNGLALQFSPARNGAVSRVFVDLADTTVYGGPANTNPSDVVLAITDDARDYPMDVLAETTVSNAAINASPLATDGSGYHVVEVDFPTPAAVSDSQPFWLRITVADSTPATWYCIHRAAGSTPQNLFHVVTWRGNYAGGDPMTEPGHVYPLTDYLTSAATKIISQSYTAYQYGELTTNGYQAFLLGDDGVGMPNQALQFSSNGRLRCTAVTDQWGEASCPQSTPAPAISGFTVTYAGDGALLRPSIASEPYLYANDTEVVGPYVMSTSATVG